MTMSRVVWAVALTTGLLASRSIGAVALDEYNPPPAGSVKIVRDTYGVPHIIARDARSLLFGAGYAQAEDQLENLYVNMLRGEGRSAEREGLSQVIFDHLMRLLESPRRAREAAAALEDDDRQHLQAFCDGVNTYLAQHRQEVPAWVEPIEPHHVVGFAMFVDTMFCVSHCRDDLEKAGLKLAALDAMLADRDVAFGSNQFAIAPHRSATGAALLSMDPHLPHSGFFRWYEMHLVGPEVNVLGACFFGSPYVSMGRTEHSAWCMTVNAPDLGDVFEFEINPDNPNQYKGPTGWQDFTVSEETYEISTPAGKTTNRMTCKRTDAGPVVVERNGKAYVFALPLLDGKSRVRQLYQMAKAQNVGQFKQALEPLGIAMFNIVYADRAGDIYYISNGRVPRRDLRIDSHALRPGDQAWARWQGFHSLADMPQVLNPKSGYLLNTNSGPQNVTPDEAPRPETFVPYLMGQKANSRWRRLAELLDADRSISWDEMRDYAADTKLEAGVEHTAAIVSVLRTGASGVDETVAEAIRVLEGWNLRTDLSSQGAALFVHLWTDEEFVKAVQDKDAPGAVARLKHIAEAFRRQFQRLDAPWSEFSRVKRGDIEMGVAGCGVHKTNGGKGRETIGAALRPSGGEIKQGRRYLTGGSSYGMLVDFSGPTRAVSCLPYGVSGNPKSPHFADQLPLYVEGKFKPAWFFPQEIAGNVESEVVLPATH